MHVGLSSCIELLFMKLNCGETELAIVICRASGWMYDVRLTCQIPFEYWLVVRGASLRRYRA